jgi:hypothetical protein
MPQWKRRVVLSLLGLILLIAGSIFAVDWMIFFFGIKTLYAGIMKPMISVICFVMVLLIGNDGFGKKDKAFLIAAFICIVPVDILMSIVGLNPNVGFDSPQFMVGGVLSITANFILTVRHGRGFHYLRPGSDAGPLLSWSFLKLPLLAYGLFIVCLIPLYKPMAAINHLAIGWAYSAFLATSMWIAWETIRQKLYPRLNAWLIAIGITGWFLTEVTGEIFNIQIGRISDLMYCIIWVFYGTNVVCMALSGFNWSGAEQQSQS